MPIITRDQLAVINFGYISGLNLLQFCPEELLLQKYATYQYLFQQGVNQAYADLKSRLSTIYDLNYVLSNANQLLKNKTGSFTISLAALTYISQIYFSQNSSDSPVQSMSGIVDIDSTVSVGTTAGGTDLLNSQSVGSEGFVWVINKYYANGTTLYVTIAGPAVDVKLSANIQSTATPTPTQQLTANLTKDDLLIEILSKLAIKKILGSSAGTNKQLQAIFDENEQMILEIMEKQRTLNPSPAAIYW